MHHIKTIVIKLVYIHIMIKIFFKHMYESTHVLAIFADILLCDGFFIETFFSWKKRIYVFRYWYIIYFPIYIPPDVCVKIVYYCLKMSTKLFFWSIVLYVHQFIYICFIIADLISELILNRKSISNSTKDKFTVNSLINISLQIAEQFI